MIGVAFVMMMREMFVPNGYGVETVLICVGWATLRRGRGREEVVGA
jgi:hypothetical protein